MQQTSKINATNSDGASIALDNFVIEDDEMWANFLRPLENRNYDVEWSMVGVDTQTKKVGLGKLFKGM